MVHGPRRLDSFASSFPSGPARMSPPHRSPPGPPAFLTLCPDWAWGQESRGWEETSPASQLSPGCAREVWPRPLAVSEQLRLSEMSFLLPGCVEGPGLPRTHTVSSLPSPSSPIPPCTLPSMDLSLLPSVHSFIHPSMQLSAHPTTHLTTHLSPNSPSVQPPSHPFSPAPTYSPTHQPADLSAHLPIYISICPFADPLFSLSSDQSTHSFIY